MTPVSLLQAPLETLAGVAGTRQKLFKRLLGNRVMDALFHLPTQLKHFKVMDSLKGISPESIQGELIILKVRVVEHFSSPGRGRPYVIQCFDGGTVVDVVLFNFNKSYVQKIYPLNAYKFIVGKVEKHLGGWRMTHPELVFPAELTTHLPTKQVIYPLTTGITQRCVTRAIENGLGRLPAIPEWISKEVLRKHHWPTFQGALMAIHNPQTEADLLPEALPRQRLLFDELLSHQLTLHLVRNYALSQTPGYIMEGTGELQQKLLELLPFHLTGGQRSALAEIAADLKRPIPMSRLVQGDVGSGKTIVAVMAILQAVESGFQAAFLAPTDILVRQHGETLAPLLEALGVKYGLLTAR